ncbi:MAG: pyridoxal kinase PdxY [Chloroflexi bacterium]|nr:pyridoxal kinase PdxY [Chloroflexota bacterium]
MKTILSIQSHVAYGHVGNCAAVLPLQLLGYEVIAVNTVQFSNHAGYESHTGMVFPPRHIEDIMAGLEERGLFSQIDAVLSGYLGNDALAAIVVNSVKRIRAVRPDALYCCDPVMGDSAPGFYVPEDLQGFFRDKGVPAADIITPNQFELSHLTGIAIKSLQDARAACEKAHGMGPKTILLTSLEVRETKKNDIQMLASCEDGQQWLVTTPKLALSPAPNGAGDMTSALFLGRLLAGEPVDKALQNTAASVAGVFEKTKFLDQRELALVAAQDCFKISQSPFTAELLN